MKSSFSEMEYAAKKRQTRRDVFLADIEAITPWGKLTQVLAPHYPNSGGVGRQPIGLERMLRMYIAQQCFGFSDEATEDARYDSQATPIRPGQRRALDQSAESEQQEWLAQLKAGIRAKVKHPFHWVKNIFKHKKARYKDLCKNTAQLFSLFGLTNLMLARRWLLCLDRKVAS